LHILFFGVALFTLCASVAWAQESKVGFVNPQRIINESKIGRIAQEDLSRLGKEKDRRVREARAAVETIQASLKKSDISVAEQQSQERDLRLKAREYENLVKDSNVEIQNEERHLIRFIMHHADAILKAIAQKRGFTIILTDPEIIGYVANSMDITDQVIVALDAMK